MSKDYKIDYASWIQEAISSCTSKAGSDSKIRNEIRNAAKTELQDLKSAAENEVAFTGTHLYDLVEKPQGTFKLRRRDRSQAPLSFFAEGTPPEPGLDEKAEYRLKALATKLKAVSEAFDRIWPPTV